MIDIVFPLFGIVALALFWRCRPEVAALAVFLGGWVVLPVGHYPPGSTTSGFPYWIIGLALPSEMPLNKAWIAPAAACLGVLVVDRAALRRLRPRVLDLPMLLWCAWPLLEALRVPAARPAGWAASLLLFGSWGLPWLLGRLCAATPAGQLLLVRAIAWSALACLPIALVEGLSGPWLYDAVYEAHPFRTDGAQRYLGFRPLGFFEDGNQYGLWIALGALAALWLARSGAGTGRTGPARAGAVLVTAMAVAAQSVGALLMLALGAGLLWVTRLVRPRTLIVGLLVAGLGVSTVYLSGAVPITRIGKETVLGQQVVDAFRAAGRGSFTWRISQDQKLLKDAMAHPLVGSGRWDWWRGEGTRPWGLAMLLLGQYGGVGLGLAFGALLLPALRALWPLPRVSGWSAAGLPLLGATLIGLTVLDALLNSFIFFPAIAIAGGLAGSVPARVRTEA